MSTKDFADTLVDELIALVCKFQNRTASVGDVERQAEMVKQALRVPSPPSEDPTIHDGYVQAALIGLLQRPTWNNDSLVAKAREIADSAMKAREVKA